MSTPELAASLPMAALPAAITTAPVLHAVTLPSIEVIPAFVTGMAVVSKDSAPAPPKSRTTTCANLLDLSIERIVAPVPGVTAILSAILFLLYEAYVSESNSHMG
jgi:hypothetical protein